MSATEIHAELPKLNAAELESIFRRAAELHRGHTVEASPEFLAAIDEADEAFANEGGVSIEEARRILAFVEYQVILAPSRSLQKVVK